MIEFRNSKAADWKIYSDRRGRQVNLHVGAGSKAVQDTSSSIRFSLPTVIL